MAKSEFDKILRERLEAYVETAPDVWDGIQAKLAARRRRAVVRRVSFAVAAAAACLVAGIFILRHPEPVQPEAVVRTDAVEQIVPIEQQIKEFTENIAVASAVVSVEPSVPAAPSVAGQPAAAAETEGNGKVEVVEEPGKKVEESVVKELEKEEDQQKLGEDDLPADFWIREEKPARTTREHTSQISILSNLSTVASENDAFFRAAPGHSSSQSGSSGMPDATVRPANGGDVKFFSPLSVGIQFKTAVADRFYISSGLAYSYLVSQYDLLVDQQMFAGAYNQLHYVGIPLSLSYNFVDTPSLGVYASVGGAVEKCVSQRYVYASNTLHQKVGGLQWSAQAGIGVEYWFVPRAGIYFDPSLVWFFDNKQPLSIRTQQPLQARLEVGFRFKL